MTDKRGPGRPATLPPTKRVVVALTEEQVAVAQHLGDGNASAGIRQALEVAAKNAKKMPR